MPKDSNGATVLEEYINSMLFMYFPFSDKEELKYNSDYSNKLN